MNLVWLKRDLRLHDHQALSQAIATGKPLTLIYFFEPSVMQAPQYDIRHWRFVWQSLQDLDKNLHQLADNQAQLLIFHAEVMPVLEALQQDSGISAIFSHQETGLKITYDRDKLVTAFCKKNKISWHEFQTNGVIRGLKNRENWQKRWYEYMQEPLQQPDFQKLIHFEISPEFYQQHKGEPLPEAITEPNSDFQPGGETFAFKYLQSFTKQRVANYSRHISKPAQSRKSCSRLSPYIAWGCLSVRQVYQSQQEAQQILGFSRQFQAFASRLRWHCHFIQKFEMEDRIESENINRGYDSLIFEHSEAHFEAWKHGKTGFPLVDACMRCLQKTGYINFRMRAMVVSFLTHQLFEHWKAGADFLATLFLDFEPGIHYPQFQMQAG
ncbi:MAG: deoxyribodipyrimidine photo-lyase, partial [Verrucomicrobia bacterium]|nr:deoxyribodipyrimidine photo-lyase [Cytophagales bacterium]